MPTITIYKYRRENYKDVISEWCNYNISPSDYLHRDAYDQVKFGGYGWEISHIWGRLTLTIDDEHMFLLFLLQNH